MNIALQNPVGSHNRHCVQRPESFELHNSTKVMLLRSSWNLLQRQIKNEQKKRLNYAAHQSLPDRPWRIPGNNASEMKR